MRVPDQEDIARVLVSLVFALAVLAAVLVILDQVGLVRLPMV